MFVIIKSSFVKCENNDGGVVREYMMTARPTKTYCGRILPIGRTFDLIKVPVFLNLVFGEALGFSGLVCEECSVSGDLKMRCFPVRNC